MEDLDGPLSHGSQPGLAIPECFVHVLRSPVVLLHDALDSNHGSSMLVLPYATSPSCSSSVQPQSLMMNLVGNSLNFFPWTNDAYRKLELLWPSLVWNFRSLLEKSLVPSVYHQWTRFSWRLEVAL